MGPIISESQRILCPKEFWVPRNISVQKIWVQKYFGAKKTLGHKKILVPIKIGSQKLLVLFVGRFTFRTTIRHLPDTFQTTSRHHQDTFPEVEAYRLKVLRSKKYQNERFPSMGLANEQILK